MSDTRTTTTAAEQAIRNEAARIEAERDLRTGATKRRQLEIVACFAFRQVQS